MNSLETLKKELIKQQKALKKIGATVTVGNINPSPSEITSAIESIDVDFTSTTATEEDVRAGKTFISQSSEIKTGTFDTEAIDKTVAKLTCFIAGDGRMEIEIPTNISRIRKYAYYIPQDIGNNDLFYKDNLVIPENIKTIQQFAFAYCQISGPIVIPETCTVLDNYAFISTQVTEVTIHGGLGSANSKSEGAFSECKKLKKATITQPITSVSPYLFQNSSLEEVSLPASVEALGTTPFKGCYSLKFIKFQSTTPPTMGALTFADCTRSKFLIPYQYSDTYFTSTYFNSNKVVGYGDFETGDTLPSELNGFSFVWYASLDDFTAGTNPITICPETGTLYASVTKITTE